MTDFADLGLAKPLLRAIRAEGYTTPSPIQGKAIPHLMAKRDLIGIAQTGTGKTAAFALPLLHRLAVKKVSPGKKGGTVLILTPTRELAGQIADALQSYGRHIKPKVALIVGGVKVNPQVKALAGGVDFIVSTPGRLIDHLEMGSVQLKDTRHLVLDEADQMLDMGFIPAIRRILSHLPSERQSIMFSATMPTKIRHLAREMLKKPIEVSVAPAARPIERIDQICMKVSHGAKRAILISLLREKEVTRAIVFCRTKWGAEKLSKLLNRAGLISASIHGNKSQNQRNAALDKFRKGQVLCLVATDVAARGIDIDDVSHVYNFELPNIPDSYVHRIGRTARAGRVGVAISLVDKTEEEYLRDIRKLTGADIKEMDPPEPAELPGPAQPQQANQNNKGGQNKPKRKAGDRRKKRNVARNRRRNQKKSTKGGGGQKQA
ncbi:MAG: DEAD/DEAH box helicase [Alphaproteobacteria bacterium]